MNIPLIVLWQHEPRVKITALVKTLGINAVWTDDEPYHGQTWEQTQMYRALLVPGVRFVIPKIERLQWGQTVEGSLRHAHWIGELSRTHPEIIGLYLNDFYDEIEEGFRTMAQWLEIITTINKANPELAIWVPHYPHRGNDKQPYDFDHQGIIFNIWDPADLPLAEQYLTQAEAQHAGKTMVGGLYLSSGPQSDRWLTEYEFRQLLALYLQHVQEGKLQGIRFFCACQFEQRPEYIEWAREELAAYE